MQKSASTSTRPLNAVRPPLSTTPYDDETHTGLAALELGAGGERARGASKTSYYRGLPPCNYISKLMREAPPGAGPETRETHTLTHTRITHSIHSGLLPPIVLLATS